MKMEIGVKVKLKPCPFCGSEAIVVNNYRGETRVECVNALSCGATQYWRDFEEGAIDAWNNRAEPETGAAAK